MVERILNDGRQVPFKGGFFLIPATLQGGIFRFKAFVLFFEGGPNLGRGAFIQKREPGVKVRGVEGRLRAEGLQDQRLKMPASFIGYAVDRLLAVPGLLYALYLDVTALFQRFERMVDGTDQDTAPLLYIHPLQGLLYVVPRHRMKIEQSEDKYLRHFVFLLDTLR